MRKKLCLGLNAYEELFMNKNELIESRLPKIYDIPIKLIDDFPAHPFRAKIHEDMEHLIPSIISVLMLVCWLKLSSWLISSFQ